MTFEYSPESRALQDRFDSRRLADRLAEVKVHQHFTPDDRELIERLDMFFLATVDGRDVLKSEWDNFHQREATRIRETMKQIDPKLLDTPDARYASLERLVREKVFAAAADKQKITASDAKLARDLGENEAVSGGDEETEGSLCASR